MANANPTRGGQANGTGSLTALYLKMFSGEVLRWYTETNVFRSKTRLKTLTSGKSTQFIVTGKGTSGYHTPGTELVGSTIPVNERTIVLDDQLVADRALADIDEAMQQYDMRSELAADIGRCLAQSFDKNVAQNLVLAARVNTPIITNGFVGTRLVNSSMKSSADQFIASCMDAAQAMDEKDVPKTDRYVAVVPDIYYNLINSGSKLIHADYGNAGNGSIADGVVRKVAGFTIVESNNVPATNITTGPASYQGDFSVTAGICWQKDAVGTAILRDLRTSVDWIPDKLVWLLLGRYIVGHGILRPECAVELATA